ncbi:MAG: D-alanyl-D-alanine carboxypeptidase family protein [Ruminococcaceae bacterium]|nr:D-alanyl-D-alanine carboxypeptidase family protein [Oscillospiraceae bacterium]
MKRNKINFLTVILALLLLLSGCINLEPEEEEGTTAPIDVSQIDKNSIGSYKTMQYTYLTDVDPATLTTGFDPTYLLLVNKQSELDVGYVPANLVTLTCATTRSMQLEARAAQALYAMMAEMNAAGIKDVMVTSAYRSYEYQQDLYDKYLTFERSGISEDASRVLGEEYIKANYLDKKIFKLSFEDALKVVQSYSALPGQSEHQTGLCLDFITSDMGGELTEAFENTQAFAWLAENAYKFGFILRYPKGMEGITGYTYEPWHYRFVGREAATDIHVGNMTLEQYLQLTAQ